MLYKPPCPYCWTHASTLTPTLQRLPMRAATDAPCHFLQRVLNSTTAELAPTQAAAIALGVPSSAHSRIFMYANVWDAVRLTDVLNRGGAFLSDALLLEPSSVGGETAPGDGGSPVPADGASDSESDGELTPEAAAPRGRCGAAAVFTRPDGEKIAVALPEHYAYRDHLLSLCSFDEFIIAFRVDKLKAGELEEPNKPHPHAGRPRMTTYRLLPPHPPHDSSHIARAR